MLEGPKETNKTSVYWTYFQGASMQPLIQQMHNHQMQDTFIDFQAIKKKYLQEPLSKNILLRPTYVSEQAYWNKYYEMKNVSYEWCNGKLEEKPMADLASFIMYNWFLNLLNEYFSTFPQGTLVGLEIGFKMVLPHQISIRKPDLALIHKSNPIQMKRDERSYKGCYNMCIEFLSDSNQQEIFRDTVIKKAEYEQAGIEEYYILDRKHTETIFYRLNSHGQYDEILPDNNGVIKSSVLTSFQFRYDDLFTLPANEVLREDPVYTAFFQTDYNRIQQRLKNAEKLAIEEKLRANEEKLRADKEKRRADEEKLRANEAIDREKKLLQQISMLKKSYKCSENNFPIR